MGAEVESNPHRRTMSYKEGRSLQGKAGETTWDRGSIEAALDSMRDYLDTYPQGVSSVFARIGFNRIIEENDKKRKTRLPQNTLLLLLIVDGDASEVESVREIFGAGSFGWNQENRHTNRFIEIDVRPTEQATEALDQSTDRYYQVYPLTDLSDSTPEAEEIHGVARERRQAKKRKGHDVDEITRAYKYQPSRDHTRLSDLPLKSDKPDDPYEKYKKDPILEERTDTPLAEVIRQRPKNYHGFARKGQLEEIARPIAEPLAELEPDKGTVHRARKFLDRLAKREARHAARTTTEPIQAQNGHEKGASVTAMKDKGEVYVYRQTLGGNHHPNSPIPHNGNGQIDHSKIIFDPHPPFPPIVRPTETLW